MKTYAEVITELSSWGIRGDNHCDDNVAAVVGFIYGVEERDVEIDIDEEFQKLVDKPAE